MITGYAGKYGGQHYESLYPSLYRVRFVQVIAGRRYDVDRIVSADGEAHARERVSRGDIRGGIAVDYLTDLERDSR